MKKKLRVQIPLKKITNDAKRASRDYEVKSPGRNNNVGNNKKMKRSLLNNI